MIQRTVVRYEADLVANKVLKVARNQVMLDETNDWATVKPKLITVINPDEERAMLDGQRAAANKLRQEKVDAIAELDAVVATLPAR